MTYLPSTGLSKTGPEVALAGIDLSLAAGEVLGVLGPSGSGKSTLGLALSGQLPDNAVVSGEIVAGGVKAATRRDWEPLLGRVVTYIPQEPALALNPVLRAITQVRDAAICCLKIGSAEANALAREALTRAGLGERDQQMAYPHELSGGQRQRVLLARAFLLGSQLVVADEPTSALDAVTQREIMRLFEELRAGGSAIVFITHNPPLLRGFASQTLVLCKGRSVAGGAQ